MTRIVKTTTVIQNNEYELTPKQIEMWTTLSKKVCKAQEYYNKKSNEFLKVTEMIASVFDYI